MPSEYRLQRLEHEARIRRVARLQKLLDELPPQPPATREELLQMKVDLAIPDAVFNELFGDQMNQ